MGGFPLGNAAVELEDTLMLQPCHELFALPMVFAAAPETHRSLAATVKWPKLGSDDAARYWVRPQEIKKKCHPWRVAMDGPTC